MAKKSLEKPTGPLFTIIDNDNLEVWTNLTESEVHDIIKQVIDGEHPNMEEAELLTIVNQTTGIPYQVEQRIEYELLVDTSQPQYRKKVEELPS